MVDAGVLGDLVDPGLERDVALGRPQAAQGGHEDVLDDVLCARVVGDDPARVRGDSVPVPAEQRIEGGVAALLRSGYELVVRGLGRRSNHQWFHRVPLPPSSY